jgi:hypothetical protein
VQEFLSKQRALQLELSASKQQVEDQQTELQSLRESLENNSSLMHTDPNDDVEKNPLSTTTSATAAAAVSITHDLETQAKLNQEKEILQMTLYEKLTLLENANEELDKAKESISLKDVVLNDLRISNERYQYQMQELNKVYETTRGELSFLKETSAKLTEQALERANQAAKEADRLGGQDLEVLQQSLSQVQAALAAKEAEAASLKYKLDQVT